MTIAVDWDVKPQTKQKLKDLKVPKGSSDIGFQDFSHINALGTKFDLVVK